MIDASSGTPTTTRPAFVDTSVVIRYLTNDPPDAAGRARRIVDGPFQLVLTPGTLAEAGFVLTKLYDIPRPAVVDALVTLLRRRNIDVHKLDKMIAIQALLLCRPSNRVSFADALLWAEAYNAGVDTTVFTFDKRFPATGIHIRDDG